MNKPTAFEVYQVAEKLYELNTNHPSRKSLQAEIVPALELLKFVQEKVDEKFAEPSQQKRTEPPPGRGFISGDHGYAYDGEGNE